MGLDSSRANPKSEPLMPKGRALVIVMGQLRAASMTWDNFRKNVLEECDADLAVCVPGDECFDPSNPFYRHAKYRWIIPFVHTLSETYDKVQSQIFADRSAESLPDWRILRKIPGPWLGGLSEDTSGMRGAIELLLRWWAFDNLKASGAHAEYERFILTRSDLYYLAPHPPLGRMSSENIWIPDGEDYWGINPRHLIASAKDIEACCNVVERIVSNPEGLIAAMNGPYWNVEKALELNLRLGDVLHRVKRFPYVMLLVRTEKDSTSTTVGAYDSQLGAFVKYGEELAEARRWAEFIKSRVDWENYFDGVMSKTELSSWRIYTFHRSIVYYDEAKGILRHGPPDQAPRNIKLHKIGEEYYMKFCKAPGEWLVDILGDGRVDLRDVSDTSASFTLAPVEREEWPRGWRWANDVIGLESGGVFLGAEPDGNVTLNRNVCSYWEQFRLMPIIADKNKGL
jgi:hypothetical protein